MANKLQQESSPYLRQHQHNPVDWHPWGETALAKARLEHKLILVSIGYSACHWCHVMERESFENHEVANIMNEHFVAIKVDREERPDIDQIYMLAVQLMTNAGGWPLNCICLPDGRPIYGGTYFKTEDWKSVLLQVATMWREQPEIAYDYAKRLTSGITESERLPLVKIPETYNKQQLEDIINPWKQRFDTIEGGVMRVPKFPLPNNWTFLLRYATLTKDEELQKHIHFTLKKIASGGIYDQIGGGFARYSVDREWHVPHFEKMLYDNAQLVSLYTEAWQHHPDPQYKRVVIETLSWVKREMTAEDGSFYCALDADSEGIEGKYYTFDQNELFKVLGSDAELFIRYFQFTEKGNWKEEGTNIPKCSIDADDTAREAGYTLSEWESYLHDIKNKLLTYREKRIRPGLDDKKLTSWNAMMLKAYCDAYKTFEIPSYLESALKNADFIQKKLYSDTGGLLHQPIGTTQEIVGFLDDYAFTIEAFISLYEATFDEHWLYEAKRLTDYSIRYFYDEDTGMFFYTSSLAAPLIARKHEIMDNVIPSSNSALVLQLHRLGTLFDEHTYTKKANQALANVADQIKSYGSAYSNWGILLLHEVFGTNEIVITGSEWETLKKEVDKTYIPNKLIAGGVKETLPLLTGRVGKETQAFVCKNKTCSQPVTTSKELLNLITQ